MSLRINRCHHNSDSNSNSNKQQQRDDKVYRSVDELALLALFALFLLNRKKFPPTHYHLFLGFLACSLIIVIMHFSGNTPLHPWQIYVSSSSIMYRCDPTNPNTPRRGAMGVRQCSVRSAALKKRCDHDGAARLVIPILKIVFPPMPNSLSWTT